MVEGNKHDIAIIQDHLFETERKKNRAKRIKIKYSFIQQEREREKKTIILLMCVQFYNRKLFHAI